MRAELTDEYNPRVFLRCPLCPDELYLHCERVFSSQDRGEAHEIQASLDFWCEQGHVLTLVVSNHKGYTELCWKERTSSGPTFKNGRLTWNDCAQSCCQQND